MVGAPSPWPVSLAFLGDCDGDLASFLDELVATAGPGLRQIFAHCEGFGPSTDLRYWMTVAGGPADRELRQLDRPHRPADPRGGDAPRGAAPAGA